MTFPADRHGNQPVLNDAGHAAMRYMRQQQLLLTCGPENNKRQHVFTMSANISLTWVPPEDIPCCLNAKGGCCGQKKPGIIIYANEAAVRQWTNGGGR